jgi:DNA-binding transcriptional regulator YiaG
MKKQKYQSELLGVLYEDALEDFKIGAITESEMREYERDCLVPEAPCVSFSANDVPARHPSPIAARPANLRRGG